MKYYKFKNVKYSVEMILHHIDEFGVYHLINKDYPTLTYLARKEELIEYEQDIS